MAFSCMDCCSRRLVRGSCRQDHCRYDPLQRCPDITLARDKLKWEPKVPLEQGLKKTIEYFDGLLKSNKEVSRVGR